MKPKLIFEAIALRLQQHNLSTSVHGATTAAILPLYINFVVTIKAFPHDHLSLKVSEADLRRDGALR